MMKGLEAQAFKACPVLIYLTPHPLSIKKHGEGEKGHVAGGERVPLVVHPVNKLQNEPVLSALTPGPFSRATALPGRGEKST